MPHIFSSSATTMSRSYSCKSLAISLDLIMLLSLMNWFRINLLQ